MAQFDLEQMQIQRRRQVADALRASGNQGFDPGATAGRMVYARSPLEDLNKVLQTGVGVYANKRADAQETDLYGRKRAAAQSEVDGLMDALAPSTQAMAGPTTDSGSVQQMKTGQILNPATGQMEPMQEGNADRMALANILRGVDPEATAPMLRQKALAQMDPTLEPKDLGDRIGFFNKRGQLVREQAKGVDPTNKYSSDVSRANSKDTVAATLSGQGVTVRGQDINNANSDADRLSREQISKNELKIKQELAEAENALKAAGIKAPTEFQTKAKGQLSRMERSELNLDKNYKPGYWVTLAANTPGGLDAVATSKEFQQYQQGAREWISGLLRLDSGAAVPDTEFARYFKTYFPQVGEDAATSKQKAQSRLDATADLRNNITMPGNQLPPAPTRANAGVIDRGAAAQPGTMSLQDYLNRGAGQ